MAKVTHWRDLRLAVNAGIQFPACYARARLLDVDKGRLESTCDKARVTCKRCSREIDKHIREVYELFRQGAGVRWSLQRTADGLDLPLARVSETLGGLADLLRQEEEVPE